jgi:hypothetical protein
LDVALKFSFPLFALLVVVGLFWQYPFTTAADLTLTQIGTRDNIRQIDQTISPFTDSAGDILDDLNDLFGEEDEADEERSDNEEGILEENFYSSLVALLAFVYRVITVIFSLFALVAVIYFSFAMGYVSQYKQIRADYEKLAERVRELEAK